MRALAHPADAKETAIVCPAPRCYSRDLRSLRWQPSGRRLVSPHSDAQNCPLTIFGYSDVSTGSSGTTCSR